METLPALAVERLSIPEAYRIGRALRFVGFILDQEQQRIEIGERAHRLLRERSQMQANADRPYSAEQVADDFLDAYGRRLSKDAYGYAIAFSRTSMPRSRSAAPMRTSRISERVRSRQGGARSTATATQL